MLLVCWNVKCLQYPMNQMLTISSITLLQNHILLLIKYLINSLFNIFYGNFDPCSIKEGKRTFFRLWRNMRIKLQSAREIIAKRIRTLKKSKIKIEYHHLRSLLCIASHNTHTQAHLLYYLNLTWVVYV